MGKIILTVVITLLAIALADDFMNSWVPLSEATDPEEIRSICEERYTMSSMRNIPAKCLTYFQK